MKEYTEYFKSKDGYDRFIKGIYEKYRSIGRFSGVVKLKCLTKDESEVLTKLYGTTLREGENVTLSINKFVDIMNNSKYYDFDISILVSEYLKVSLSSKKEDESKSRSEEEEFYKEFMKEDSLGCKWLRDAVSNKGTNVYKVIHERYRNNKFKLGSLLKNIILLIDNLPSKSCFLSIFASSITGDPHYLDFESNNSSLFFHALSYVDGSSYPDNREDKVMLLSKYNILIDNLSNYVLTYNLVSDSEGINDFSSNGESLILNIQNIVNRDTFDGKDKKVFVFENPSLLSYVISCNLDVTVVISGGFPNISVYLLLDKLVESGNILFYNGDYDPEGLLIAQKIKNRYQENVVLVSYDEKSYLGSISSNVLKDYRLKKLQSVNHENLNLVKEKILEVKYAGYQENIKDELVDFIEKNLISK